MFKRYFGLLAVVILFISMLWVASEAPAQKSAQTIASEAISAVRREQQSRSYAADVLAVDPLLEMKVEVMQASAVCDAYRAKYGDDYIRSMLPDLKRDQRKGVAYMCITYDLGRDSRK